jgi:hypothetical protein
MGCGQRHALPRFMPGEGTPGTHCTGGWVGLRDGLDTEAKGNILSPLQGIEPGSPCRPARSQTDWAIRLSTFVKFKLENKESFTFQPSKVPTKIYILSCIHISFKTNGPHADNSRLPEDQQPPSPRERAPQFGNIRIIIRQWLYQHTVQTVTKNNHQANLPFLATCYNLHYNVGAVSLTTHQHHFGFPTHLIFWSWSATNSWRLACGTGCVDNTLSRCCGQEATLVQILQANLSSFPSDEPAGPGSDRALRCCVRAASSDAVCMHSSSSFWINRISCMIPTSSSCLYQSSHKPLSLLATNFLFGGENITSNILRLFWISYSC